jgi:hypothetical protein
MVYEVSQPVWRLSLFGFRNNKFNRGWNLQIPRDIISTSRRLTDCDDTQGMFMINSMLSLLLIAGISDTF